MRVAVLSDIHSNLPALDGVLADVESEAPDEVWCLGDLVGYGASPNECCTRMRQVAQISLCGNHDLAVIGALEIEDFTGDAAAAARWTQAVLAGEHRDWLASLQPAAERSGAELFHGSPRDPVWDYVLSEEVALASLELTSATVVLVGHSHVALALSEENGAIEGGLAPAGTEIETAERRWLLNPGSVGQPRDGDARAAWLLVDFEAGRIAFRRVAYDIQAAQAQILAAGLPRALADRLAVGV